MKMTRQDVDYAYEFLGLVLRRYSLPVRVGGPYRTATVGEFMLMDQTPDSGYRFKHRETRNYLCMRPDGTIWVPYEPGDAFFGGFFGEVVA